MAKSTWSNRNRRRCEDRAFGVLADRTASGNEISRALNQACCVSRFTAMSGLLVLLTTGLLYLRTSARKAVEMSGAARRILSHRPTAL